MKKITDYSAVTDRDIDMGILVNYTGSGFGCSRVGLIVKRRDMYYIQWATGKESIEEHSLSSIADNNDVEMYIP